MFGFLRRDGTKTAQIEQPESDGIKTAQIEQPESAVKVLAGPKCKVTVRIPTSLMQDVRAVCRKQGISVNEGTILLYKYLALNALEFQILKKVRKVPSL